jgi:hypothetical protein
MRIVLRIKAGKHIEQLEAPHSAQSQYSFRAFVSQTNSPNNKTIFIYR